MKRIRSIHKLIIAIALLAWCPYAIHAQDELSDSIEESGEGETRLQAVTDAVASDPEMAPEIVGSLVRNFPDAAAAIAASAVEGLPERSPENVNAIVVAAAEAAPGEREAIEASVATVAPELFEHAEEAVSEALPERLQREVDLVSSLIATYPDNAPSVTRRSVARVADEEAFWSTTIVETALAGAPDQEGAIVRAAILGVPHYEGEIREAAGWEPVVEEEPSETTDQELPERLQRELDLVASLIGTYPGIAGVATRRSVSRVSDEEAFWSVAVVTTALEYSPEREREIVSEAIAAAPHYEGDILEAVGWEAVESVEEVVAAEPYRMEGVVERGELRNNMYYVRLDMRGTERSLKRRKVETLELRISPERYFDPYEGRYLDRNAAVISGDDIVGLAFKLVPGDEKQRDGIASVLMEFEEKVEDAREFVARKREAEEPVLLGDHRISLGSVYLYPSRKEVDVEMQADFNDERYLMRIGSSITVSPETAGAIRHLVENLDRYNEEYQALLDRRERQSLEFRDFARAEPVEAEEEAEAEEDVEVEAEEEAEAEAEVEVEAEVEAEEEETEVEDEEETEVEEEES